MSKNQLPIISELESLINIDYEYYQELIEAGVTQRLAFLRATFRYLIKEHSGIKQSETSDIIRDVCWDEYYLMKWKHHSRYFSDLKTFKLEDMDLDKVKALKKLNFDYVIPEESLSQISDKQLEEELARRTTPVEEVVKEEPLVEEVVEETNYFDIDIDFDELDDSDELDDLDLDDDIELDDDFDDDFDEDLDDDLHLDFEEADESHKKKVLNEIKSEYNNSLPIVYRVLNFFKQRGHLTGDYASRKKIEDEVGVPFSQIKPLLEDMIENGAVHKSGVMYPNYALNCYSVSQFGYRILRILEEMLCLEQNDYENEINKLNLHTDSIDKGLRLYDLFNIEDDGAVKFFEYRKEYVSEIFLDNLNKLDKEKSNTDSIITYYGNTYSYKYDDTLQIIDMLRVLRDKNPNSRYNSFIGLLQDNYRDDSRTHSKYLRKFIQLSKKDKNGFFAINKDDCANELFGGALEKSNYIIWALHERDFIRCLGNIEEKEKYHIREEAKSYL
ncbi:hypothetical protein Q6U52_000894 [Vibrio alginolyticus]|nr:hypothetical protein [Vibrio alginolyticus]